MSDCLRSPCLAKVNAAPHLAHGAQMEFAFEGVKQNKQSLRQLLLEEVTMFEHADRAMQDEHRRGGGHGMPPPSPR